MIVLLCLRLLASPVNAQVLAEKGAWALSRDADEHFGAGFGCPLTLVARRAQRDLTACFPGAYALISAQKLALEPHTGTLVLFVPSLDKAMSFACATFDGQTIRPRGGEQVFMAMMEEIAAANAPDVAEGEGDTPSGGCRGDGLAGILPDKQACLSALRRAGDRERFPFHPVDAPPWSTQARLPTCPLGADRA